MHHAPTPWQRCACDYMAKVRHATDLACNATHARTRMSQSDTLLPRRMTRNINDRLHSFISITCQPFPSLCDAVRSKRVLVPTSVAGALEARPQPQLAEQADNYVCVVSSLSCYSTSVRHPQHPDPHALEVNSIQPIQIPRFPAFVGHLHTRTRTVVVSNRCEDISTRRQLPADRRLSTSVMATATTMGSASQRSDEFRRPVGSEAAYRYDSIYARRNQKTGATGVVVSSVG